MCTIRQWLPALTDHFGFWQVKTLYIVQSFESSYLKDGKSMWFSPFHIAACFYVLGIETLGVARRFTKSTCGNLRASTANKNKKYLIINDRRSFHFISNTAWTLSWSVLKNKNCLGSKPTGVVHCVYFSQELHFVNAETTEHERF